MYMSMPFFMIRYIITMVGSYAGPLFNVLDFLRDRLPF